MVDSKDKDPELPEKRKVVPPRQGPSQPVDGEPMGEEETRVFRREYFDGKTREEVEALLQNADQEGKNNPWFRRAGEEALSDLDALEGGKNGKEDTGESGVESEEIANSRVETADNAIKVLKNARKAKKKAEKKGEDFEISIADQTIENPERAYENFLEALKLAKAKLPGFLKASIEDIKFQKLAGQIVGKSTEDGVTIDPIMLLHPVMKMATVLFHEFMHANNQVPNEGLIQSQAEMHFGGITNVKEYDEAVLKFTKFADIYGNGKIDNASKEVYKLYYQASKNNDPTLYLKIYSKFIKRASKLRSFPNEDSIKKFFFEVFPELKMVKVDVD